MKENIVAYKAPSFIAYIDSQNGHINLDHAGWDVCAPLYTYGPAVRKTWIIHYVTRGKGIYSVGHKSYRIGENMAFLIPPGISTVYSADKDDPWEYYFFSFSGAMAEEIVKRTGFAGDYAIEISDGRIPAIIRETAETVKNGIDNPDVYGCQKLFELIKIFIDSGGDSYKRSTFVNSYVASAMRYMEANYAQPMSIDTVADHIGINRSYLCRLFRSEINITPMEYLNDIRIQNSKQLLVTTSIPVTEVGNAVGISTQSAFYRLFSEKYGITPGKYRRAALSGKEDENLIGKN
ncbi:MAG: AraC family transcriptional regulator [Clostridia bacterium]|nr:AraC family transcriptional regulator [Clostridia bacterium]